jgi:hypothetical protein
MSGKLNYRDRHNNPPIIQTRRNPRPLPRPRPSCFTQRRGGEQRPQRFCRAQLSALSASSASLRETKNVSRKGAKARREAVPFLHRQPGLDPGFGVFLGARESPAPCRSTGRRGKGFTQGRGGEVRGCWSSGPLRAVPEGARPYFSCKSSLYVLSSSHGRCINIHARRPALPCRTPVAVLAEIRHFRN